MLQWGREHCPQTFPSCLCLDSACDSVENWDIVVQAELPYSSKPKDMAKRKRLTLEQRRAVVLEPHERKAAALIQQLNALRNAKDLARRVQQQHRHEVLSSALLQLQLSFVCYR